MKKTEHSAVIEARADLEAKRASLASAESAVEQAKKEFGAALGALQQAQRDADATLPQCRSVSISSYSRSGAETEAGRLVLLRKTPTGILVARRFGEPDRGTFNFVWNRYSHVYVEKAKRDRFYQSSHLELRDVPAEFMPTEAVKD